MARLTTVISGGQSGVDRAALGAAEACGLERGGWCPPGRASDSGAIPLHFPLEETPEERSPRAPDVPRSLRTEWNVRDSDATLILRPAELADPGTDWSETCAAHYGRPCLTCDPAAPEAPRVVSEWLEAARVGTLNVAGPSEAACPGIGARAYALLVEVFSFSRSDPTAGGGGRSR